VTVAEEGQMTRAARRLQLAQPALSQAIARLEAQVGVKLLERNPRGVTATPAGQAFLVKARAVLDAVDAAQATARSLARAETGRLLIGFLSLTPPMLAAELFNRFSEENPGVELAWRELGYPKLDVREWLGDSDAALAWMAPTGPGVASHALRTSPVVVAVAERHPLAARNELTVADVIDETFPGVAPWCDPGWLGFWGLDGYRGGPARRTGDAAESPQEMASIVAAGRAITTVPEIVAMPFGPLGIKAIPLVDADPAVLNLVWRPEAVAPLLDRLLTLARETALTGDAPALP
jgi:DNA-binding transcriptional LysR family regulator